MNLCLFFGCGCSNHRAISCFSGMVMLHISTAQHSKNSTRRPTFFTRRMVASFGFIRLGLTAIRLLIDGAELFLLGILLIHAGSRESAGHGRRSAALLLDVATIWGWKTWNNLRKKDTCKCCISAHGSAHGGCLRSWTEHKPNWQECDSK